MVVPVKLPKWSKVGFTHEEPELFVTTQWTRNAEKSWTFLLFRWLLAGFFIGVVSYSWTNAIVHNGFRFWFLYMTSWGIFICMLSTTFSACLTTLYHFKCITMTTQSVSYKVQWFLSNVAVVLAFMITVVYWSVLFNGTTSTLDILIHGGNSVMMLLELMVVRQPFFVFHFIYSISVGLIYLIFTIIFYFAGGVDGGGNRYIYEIISWETPGKAALVAVGVMILSLFLHIFAFIIQKARHRVHKKVFKRDSLEVNIERTVV